MRIKCFVKEVYEIATNFPSSLDLWNIVYRPTLQITNGTFRRMELFPCSGHEIPTLLGPLERANFR
jgi:hypothetical protein